MAVLAYLPARGSIHWVLRVVVPEFGLLLLPLGILPAAWLGKAYPKTSAALLVTLAVLVFAPWFQAARLASVVPREMKSIFPEAPERHPLLLGERRTHTRLTEVYGGGKKWDRYQPEGEPKGRILFLHGGSWRNGERDDYPQIFEYLADRGYEVLSPTYTLSGEEPYPAALSDIEVAIEKAHSPNLPLFVAGRSSGGHLALLGSYNKSELVSGVIGFYPPVDMVWSYQNPSNPYVLDSQEAMIAFLEETPPEAPEKYSEASPIEQVTAGAPPTLLIHGGSDCLVFPRQSEMLSERLSKFQVPHYLLSLPWAEHGGDVQIYGPTGRLSLWAMEAFLESEKHFRP